MAPARLPGRGGGPAAREVRAALGQRAAAAQRVGLVEEHDHAAVPEREPAQLAEQGLDLEDADAHEHVDERARVHEHVRAAGLARHRLRHQRLAGAGRSPEQDAAGHVAAPGLDLLRVLQVQDVLFHPLQDMVLAPDVGEPGLDVVRVVDIHAAPGQEPEDRGELEHHEEQDDDQLRKERQRAPDIAGQVEQGVHRGGVLHPAEHHRDHGDPEHPGEQAPEAEPGPVGQLPVGDPLGAAEHPVGPEVVIASRVLADQEVDLAQGLQADQDEDPGARPGLDPERVGPADQRVTRLGQPEQDEPEHGQQEQELDPVPEREGLAGPPVLVAGPAAWRPQPFRRIGGGHRHHGLLTVKEFITVSIWLWCLL